MNLQSRQGAANAVSPAILNALPHPVLLVDADDAIISANQAAEQFLQAGAAVLVDGREARDHVANLDGGYANVLTTDCDGEREERTQEDRDHCG